MILPAALPVLQLFLFGPLTLYSGNTGEFDTGFWSLVGSHAWIGILAVAGLTGIGMVLPGIWRQRYIAGLTGLSLAIWIQGAFLIRNYGQFGSNDADWSAFKWAPWIDGSMWILVVVGSIALAGRLARIANQVCGALGGLLAILFVVTLAGLKPSSIANLSVAPTETVQFSRGRNVVHFVFDELQSTLLAELLAEPGSELAGLMEGFTVFSNTSASFPTTIMSMPVIHSGRVFDNSTPARSFLEGIYRQDSLTTANSLAGAGYSVDLVSPHGWQHGFMHRSFFKLPVPYGAPPRVRARVEAAALRNLVMFRYAPHTLKAWIARRLFGVSAAGDGGAIAMPDGDENADGGRWVYARHFAHRDFMKDFVDRMHVGGSKPTYKFVHSLSTHYPAVYNSDGSPAGSPVPFSWEAMRVQIRATLTEFASFLRKAKELGIYDDMLIVLNSDHGYYKMPDSAKMVDMERWARREEGYPVLNEEAFAQIICAAQPMLAVKPPGSRGRLSESRVPASLADIPATIAALVGVDANFPGESVFALREGMERKRTFAYYSRLMGSHEDYFQGFVRYEISGFVSDPNAWSLQGDVQDIPAGLDHGLLVLPLNAPVSLDESGFAEHVKAVGLHKPGTGGVWTELPVVDVVVRVPGGTRSILFNVAGANIGSVLPVQFVEAEVNGRPARQWLVRGGEVLSVPVPESPAQEQSTVRVTLRLHDAVQRSVVVQGSTDTRVLGVLLSSITASDAEAAAVFQSPFEREVIVPPGRLGLLGFGWGAPSASGRRWSVGNKAVIRWRDDPAARARALRIVFDRVYTGPGGEPQRVRATIGGRSLGDWRVVQPGELIMPLPLEAQNASRWKEVTLSLPDAISPASRGESEDQRELAIQITEISLK